MLEGKQCPTINTHWTEAAARGGPATSFQRLACATAGVSWILQWVPSFGNSLFGCVAVVR